MRLLTTVRKAPPAPVSADAVALVVGTSAEELVRRFGSTEVDFMGRPLLSFEAARLAYDEFTTAVNRHDEVLAAYLRYQDERPVRRREVGEAAKAAVRETYQYPHRGGQEMERYMQAQWAAERASLAEFDAAEPDLAAATGREITLTEFRERHR